MAELDPSLLPTEDDLIFEEELLRTPHQMKVWWRYLEARKDATTAKRHLLYERALRALPGSYKLWHAYLSERLEAARGSPPGSAAHEALNNTFERALVTMHKMPRIWELFLRALVDQHVVTRTRRACDRALAALPVTQHDRVWTVYLVRACRSALPRQPDAHARRAPAHSPLRQRDLTLKRRTQTFARQEGVPVETSLRVYRRYLKLEPGHAEEYIEFLKTRSLWNEAALRLADVVNDDMFVSLAGKSKHQLWLELCDVITKHPAEVTSLPVDAILRGGVRKFTDEVGRLWTSLADFYIRRGLFEKARDVYEEGLATVITVRDFSLVFDAFTQFEESMLSAKMEAAVDAPEPDGDDAGEGVDFVLRDNGDDMDLRLARLEHLMERRPELLSSVMLRQNPHNVHEWMKRVAIFEGKPERQILTFTEAVKTVLPDRAVGRPHTIWVAFARFYEEHGDVVNARVIFDKATAGAYKTVEELASVWCEWAEMELRAKNFPGALELMRRATAAPARVRGASLEDGPVQARVHRSLKLWSFYCDLEESLGTLEGSRRVYDAMLDLRVATPQTVLNYAALLQETKHWEDSFAVYERGVNAFKYPHVKDIWLAYLQEFVARYGGRKLERARDLYEQAVTAFPPDACKLLYMAYAKLEEEHGLARHAMDIYARCAASVPDSEKLAVYELYCARAMDAFGVPKVRSIYQTAIEAELPDGITLVLCSRFAALERKLGEIDRARALYIHASQFANPASEAGFWEDWNAFEVKHGNEDTFREMLRIKRSVSAAFSQTHFNMSVVELAARAGGEAPPVEAAGPAGGDPMAALDAQVASAGLRGFVSAGITGGTASAAANDEEISLGDDDDGEAMEAPEPVIEQQVVPEAVFGDVAAAAAAGKAIAADAAGALARFAKRQKTV